jgi:predicted phosphodiesterase
MSNHTTQIHLPARREYLRKLIEKFPKHGALTIAKAAYKERPEWFTSVETARDAVRSILGSHGGTNTVYAKELRRDKRSPGQKVEMPQSKAKPWLPFDLQASKVAIFSDVHVPYHRADAVDACITKFEKFKPDCILLNGDIADCFSISRWEKDPRARNFKEEVQCVVQFLSFIRSKFPKARIVYKLGNHEERWYSYLFLKAPELVGLEFTDFASLVHASDYGIEVIDQQRIVNLGKLPVLHGHELPKGLTNPVNPARGAFLRTIDCVLIGHHHRTSEHTEQSMGGRMITTWSTGCLCDLTPEYARLNRWNHGAAHVEISNGGDFHVTNFRIREGQLL